MLSTEAIVTATKTVVRMLCTLYVKRLGWIDVSLPVGSPDSYLTAKTVYGRGTLQICS